MRHSTLRLAVLLMVAALAATAATGCHKKAPVTTDQIAEVPPVEAAPAPRSAPAPEPEPAFDPWSADLETLNAYIREHGLMDDVYFDYDRAELRSDSRERLAKNARFLTEHPELVVGIEGHCDERGTNDYNLALGQSRAFSAKEYMSHLGTSTTRLTPISYGKERPVCIDSVEDCWWRNRRAAFVVIGRAGAG
jgi:peptidoglycan-associated lipoprotein